ncbi:MAG: lipoyl(octanoyl) transferase LipB [Armatimonadota bacterium]|jgi:lipoate-protein ligase B
MRPCLLITPGTMSYESGARLQEALADARRAGDTPDVLVLLEHPPVVTIGRGGGDGGLLVSREELVARGIEVHECSRGGKVTYHGPGQLVGYPVLDLSHDGRDLNAYLRNLEGSLIAALGGFGIAALRRPGLTGVWTEAGKIAAIGIAVRHWITSHGFALNVSCDLAPFGLIDPCGLQESGVTSMARELGHAVAFDAVQCEVAHALAMQFGLELQPCDRMPSPEEVSVTELVNHIAAVRC